MRNAIFVSRPWCDRPPSIESIPAGMLRTYEAALFYYLARDWYSGAGAIVDAGAFLGKSAYYFACGLRDGGRAATGRIHCFDNFIVNDPNTIDFIQTYCDQSLRLGESTRAIFERQVAPVRDSLTVHEADFHKATWHGEPIEILMVDIAKSRSLGQRVVEIFFPCLVPELSVVVQQDYHHPWLPHIHVVMEYLSPCFEIVASRVDDSAAFTLTKAIPADMLRRAVAYDFAPAEQLELMDRALARLPDEDRHYLELARVVLKMSVRGWREASLDLATVELTRVGCRADTAWSSYAMDVRNYVDMAEGWDQKERVNMTRALELADKVLARGSRDTFPWALRGSALMAMGRSAEAEVALRAAVACRPRSGYACGELAELLRSQSRYGEAETLLAAAVGDADAVGATNQYFCDSLAKLWETSNDRAGALAALEKLKARAPHEQEVWVLDGRVSNFLGDRARATQSLKEAVRLGLPAERQRQLRSESALAWFQG